MTQFWKLVLKDGKYVFLYYIYYTYLDKLWQFYKKYNKKNNKQTYSCYSTCNSGKHFCAGQNVHCEDLSHLHNVPYIYYKINI